AEGHDRHRVHRAAEPGRALRAAHDASRGDLRARDVRRIAERRARGRAVILGPELALVLSLFASAVALEPPRPEMVRAGWRPSDAVLLDRHGDVLHERRIDATRRRLAWTALDDVSPALVWAVLRSEDRRFRQHGGVDARAIGA